MATVNSVKSIVTLLSQHTTSEYYDNDSVLLHTMSTRAPYPSTTRRPAQSYDQRDEARLATLTWHAGAGWRATWPIYHGTAAVATHPYTTRCSRPPSPRSLARAWRAWRPPPIAVPGSNHAPCLCAARRTRARSCALSACTSSPVLAPPQHIVASCQYVKT